MQISLNNFNMSKGALKKTRRDIFRKLVCYLFFTRNVPMSRENSLYQIGRFYEFKHSSVLIHHIFILSPPPSCPVPSHISISARSNFPHLPTQPTQNSHCNLMSFLLRPVLACSSLFLAKFLETCSLFVSPTSPPISC